MHRRPRVVVPAFVGTPVPKRRDVETERSALIIIICFHLWTLRAPDAHFYVPFAGELRHHDVTWEAAMMTRPNVSILVAEAARYANHMLSVYRVWPRDGEDDVRSGEDVGDEKLVLTRGDLQEAVNTNMQCKI